jgi:hypothetical protein
VPPPPAEEMYGRVEDRQRLPGSGFVTVFAPVTNRWRRADPPKSIWSNQAGLPEWVNYEADRTPTALTARAGAVVARRPGACFRGDPPAWPRRTSLTWLLSGRSAVLEKSAKGVAETHPVYRLSRQKFALESQGLAGAGVRGRPRFRILAPG